MFLGNVLAGLGCATVSPINNQYCGAIDEFQIYSRELNATEIASLANP